MAIPQDANQRWSLDFVSDMLTDGRRFQILCVIDDFSREYLATVVDHSISGERVARELDIAEHRGYGKLLTDADDQSAFQRIVYMVQDAHEELEQVRSEIVAATDLDRMRAPHTWAFKQLPFNQRRGTGMHFNDDGDVFLEWQHGDGRRTGTQYAAVMNYERDDRGGIASETPVKPKKVKEAA